MEITEKIDHWAVRHHPAWIDVLRMALGVFIFIKGVIFIQNTEGLERILVNSQFEWVSFGLAHYVAFAHLVGGPLIAMGLITRIAILFQLPILIGAVIFVNAKRGFYSENSELWLSLLTLVLLIVFLILGSGPLSVDAYMRRRKTTGNSRSLPD